MTRSLHQREYLLSLLHEPVRRFLGFLAEHAHHFSRLPHHLFRRLDQLLVQFLSLGFLVFPFAPQLSMQDPGGLPSRTQSRTAELLHVLDLLFEQWFGSLHDTGEHTYAIHEQSTVGGVMDLGLHTGGVQPQLAALRHPGLDRQLYHPVVQCMQRFRTKRMSPADQRRFGRHRLEVHTSELAQHQAIGHPFEGFFVTPAVQMLEQQEAQDDFDRGGMAPISQRLWGARAV